MSSPPADIDLRAWWRAKLLSDRDLVRRCVYDVLEQVPPEVAAANPGSALQGLTARSRAASRYECLQRWPRGVPPDVVRQHAPEVASQVLALAQESVG